MYDYWLCKHVDPQVQQQTVVYLSPLKTQVLLCLTLEPLLITDGGGGGVGTPPKLVTWNKHSTYTRLEGWRGEVAGLNPKTNYQVDDASLCLTIDRSLSSSESI